MSSFKSYTPFVHTGIDQAESVSKRSMAVRDSKNTGEVLKDRHMFHFCSEGTANEDVEIFDADTQSHSDVNRTSDSRQDPALKHPMPGGRRHPQGQHHMGRYFAQSLEEEAWTPSRMRLTVDDDTTHFEPPSSHQKKRKNKMQSYSLERYLGQSPLDEPWSQYNKNQMGMSSNLVFDASFTGARELGLSSHDQLLCQEALDLLVGSENTDF